MPLERLRRGSKVVRLTEAQAKKLGINLGKKSAGEKKPTKAKGRSRAKRCEYNFEPVEFTVRLDHDPKPKERPRTVVDRNILHSCFLAARGNVGAFMEMVNKKISRTYTPQSTLDYERLVADHAKIAMAGKAMFYCPVETSLIFVLKGEDDIWPTSRLDGDADNLEKSVLDALNGIVFEDDKLVVKSIREKRCGAEPCVHIRIAPAKP